MSNKRFKKITDAVKVYAVARGTKRVAGVDTGITVYDIYQNK